MPAFTVCMPEPEDHGPSSMIGFHDLMRAVVAKNMNAIDPATDQMVRYDRNIAGLIDSVIIEVKPHNFMGSAHVMMMLVTYGWPDRMRNIEERLQLIADGLAPFIKDTFSVDERRDAINITFLAKEGGCWVCSV